MSDIPEVLKIDNKHYISYNSLLQDGWYCGWVPLPPGGNFEIEYKCRYLDHIIVLRFEDGRWRGDGWAFDAERGTGEPDDDFWRIRQEG